MSAHLIHIADRALNRPLLITRDKAQVILSVLAGRIGVNSPEASRFEGSPHGGGGARSARPYNVADNVAIITITGSLVNRGAWVGASSGLTSYEGIGHQLKTALADDTVHSVILDLHSPGGEAVGAFETAELVRQLSAKKRTIAVVNGMAASAAYAIASGATEIVTTETGVSGSIGVVLLHADFSRQLDREGITPTLIHAGAHKVDGNPFEPLSDDVRDDLQAEVNSFYDAFLATVAQGRGNRLTVEKARSTEAKTFIGKAAVAAGVADRVGSFETVLEDLTRAPKGKSPSKGISPMSKNATAANDPQGYDAGYAAGVAAATERFATVISADGIKGQPAALDAALDLLTSDANLSAETAIRIVTKLNLRSGPSAASLANRIAASREGDDPLGQTDQPAANGGRLTALAKQMDFDKPTTHRNNPASHAASDRGGHLIALAQQEFGSR